MGQIERHANRRAFIGGSDARIIMGVGRSGPASGCGGRNAAKPSPRTCPETSLSSSGGSPKTSTGIGLNATPARWSSTSRSGSGTPWSAIWRPPSTAGSKQPERSLRPSSCCLGASPRRVRPKSICRSCSTTCGSPMPRRGCFRSSPVAANGWKSPSPPTRSTSTCC